MSRRGAHQGAAECGRCGAVRSRDTVTTVKYRPLRRFIQHLISSEEGRTAVLQWTKEAASLSGRLKMYTQHWCLNDNYRFLCPCRQGIFARELALAPLHQLITIALTDCR